MMIKDINSNSKDYKDDQRYQLQRFQGWSKISTPKISRMIKDINSNSKDYKDDINSKFKDYKE